MRAILLTLVLAVPGPVSMADEVRDAQWHVETMGLTAVHQRAIGTGITVAVVDSGVDSTHVDLSGQVLPGPSDVDGRGTALAGLIAGHGHDSGNGVLGVAPGAKILPIAFAPVAAELGDPDMLGEGIQSAVAQGARIICIGRGIAPSIRLQTAVEDALSRGVLIVAPDADQFGRTFSPWPASYAGVLTAIPVDREGKVPVAPLSQQTTGVAVPGVNLMTTGINQSYRVDSGASAAAILAGAAAVVWSANPRASAVEVIQRLRNTSADRGLLGADNVFGTGTLNLGVALAQGIPTPSAVPSPSRVVSAAPSPSPSVVAAPTPSEPPTWVLAVPLMLFFIGLALWTFRASHRTPAPATPPASPKPSKAPRPPKPATTEPAPATPAPASAPSATPASAALTSAALTSAAPASAAPAASATPEAGASAPAADASAADERER